MSTRSSAKWISLLIAGVISATTCAIARPHLTNAQLRAEIRKVSLQTQELEKEVKQLQTELHRREQSTKHAKRHHHLVRNEHHPAHHLPPPQHVHSLISRFRHAVTVTTSPFMGLRTAFDASDLLQQLPTINEDLRLLKQRAKLSRALGLEGYKLTRPIIEISGGIEGQVIYSSGFGGSSGSINLSMAELDINAIASSWANAFMSVDFDDSPQSVTGRRVPNSRIYLRRGFLNIGNLLVAPVYFTIGQFYMPFGRYPSGMISAPLTLSMGRVLARGMLLGFIYHGFHMELYGFDGNQTTTGNKFIKQGGFNIGVIRSGKKTDYDIGAGVTSNLADSEGMQNNGLTQASNPGAFHGFGEPTFTMTGDSISNFNNLRHRVPAFNLHAEVTTGPVTIIAEYIRAFCRFNPFDMTFNAQGALVSTVHAELDWMIHYGIRPLTIGVAYGHSWQALALNLPQQSYSIFLITSFWKDTIEEIEYRHDVNYPVGTVATGGTTPGNGGVGFSGLLLPVPPGNGGRRNTVIGQVGVYF